MSIIPPTLEQITGVFGTSAPGGRTQINSTKTRKIATDHIYCTGNVIILGNLRVGNLSIGEFNVNDDTITINGDASELLVLPRYLIKRWQEATDTADGYVIGGDPYTSGTASASTIDTITLSVSASSTDDFYVDMWVLVSGGLGANQARQIIAYDGTTKIAILSTPWTVTPGATLYAIYDQNYAMIGYDENSSVLQFGFVKNTTETDLFTSMPISAQTIALAGDTFMTVTTSGCVLNFTSSYTSGTSTLTFPFTTDTLVAKNTTDVLTNKTITSATNTVHANSLKTTGASVNVASAAPPSTGQVLQATSTTTATWQTIATGGVAGPVSSTVTAIARWGDTTGESLTDSTVLVDTDGNITAANSVTFVSIAANPDDDPNTIWKDSTLDGFRAGEDPILTSFGTAEVHQIPIFVTADANIVTTSSAYVRRETSNLLLLGVTAPNSVTGVLNTHIGAAAGKNTSPLAVDGNTYVGAAAGTVCTGEYNTAIGAYALTADTAGVGNNVAAGARALQSCTNAQLSVVVGSESAAVASVVANDVFVGHRAGYSINTSSTNVCVGTFAAGFEVVTPVTGFTNNVFIGNAAGYTASLANGCARNIVIGYTAGTAVTSNTDCIYLANLGVAAETGRTRIGIVGTHTHAFFAGIRGVITANADAIPVLIDSAGQLGTVSSSAKYKENIEDMGDSSVLHKMRPVEFNYIGQEKKSIGLVAEEIVEIYPEMAVYQDGELLTVDYARLPILLLAELKKLRAEFDALKSSAIVM